MKITANKVPRVPGGTKPDRCHRLRSGAPAPAGAVARHAPAARALAEPGAGGLGDVLIPTGSNSPDGERSHNLASPPCYYGGTLLRSPAP